MYLLQRRHLTPQPIKTRLTRLSPSTRPIHSRTQLHLPTPSNPFSHPNDSAFSLDSQDTERAAPAPARSWGAPKTGTLDERERRLRDREAEVARREEAVGVYTNNWPPCAFWLGCLLQVLMRKVFPLVHHDISSSPQTVKFLYYQWLLLVATLIINLLGCIFLLISGSSEGG